MNRIKHILMALLLGSATFKATAQSSSFNQYHLTPVYTSPAEAGTTDYLQVLGHYRKQSLAQDQGYRNFALSAIYPLYLGEGGRRFGGVSLGIMNETSGMLGILKESSLKAGYAYNWQIDQVNHISIGLQGGYYRRNIDLGNVRTDHQYQNGVYVPGYGSGETFTDGLSQAFKADGGATWYMLDEYGDQRASFGIAAFNLNSSSYQFLESTQEQAMPLAYQAYGSIRALAQERWQLVPTFLYKRERNASQLNLGSLFLYQLQGGGRAMHESHLGLGAWYSLQNAAIFSLEVVKPNYLFSITYSLPASSKIEYQQVNNGVELTFGWRLNRGKGRKSSIKNVQVLTSAVERKAESPKTEESVEEERQVVVQEEEKKVAPQEIKKKAERVEKAGLEKIEAGKLELSPKEVEIVEQEVAFSLGSAQLSTAVRSELTRVGEVLNQHPELKLLIVGHTCTLGPELLNTNLSLERAQVAKEALVAEGIAPDRIQTEGRSYLEPIASNDTEEGRKQNRRVEFIIVE